MPICIQGSLAFSIKNEITKAEGRVQLVYIVGYDLYDDINEVENSPK